MTTLGSSGSAPLSDRSPAQRRVESLGIPDYVIVGMIGALIIFSLDTETLSFIPLLPHVAKEFGLSATQSAWSLSATSIAAAATIPLLSRLGDVIGLRKILLASLLIVAAGNVVCAVASGPAVFLIGRAIVGINAGLPVYYAILRSHSTKVGVSDRYAGVMTAALGLGLSLSFPFAGLILQAGGSVRLVLWIVAGISVLVCAVVWLFVYDAPTRTRVPLDFLGAVLVGGGLAALVIALGQANKWGWGSTKVIGLLLASVVLLVGWATWELRIEYPLINLRAIRRREMWPAFVAAGLATVVGVNLLLVVSNFLQTPPVAGYGFGFTVLKTGLYLLPAGLMIAFGGSFMAPLIERVGERTAIIVGGVILLVLCLWASGITGTKGEFLVITFVLGVGYAPLYTGGVIGYLRAARPGEQGMITGSARAVALGVSAIGPALITAILTASTIGRTPIPQKANYGHAFLLFAGLGAAAIVVGLLIRESQFDQRPTDDVEFLQPLAVETAEPVAVP